MKDTITGNDYARAAQRLGCNPAAIEAVASVESRGSGFNPDESPKTLFEGHVFHRLTKGRFASSHPALSYPNWTRDHYGRNWQDEAARLQSAMRLDETAALMATSWGKFQIMGFNHGACSYGTVQAFVEAMKISEALHLDAFVELIIAWDLGDELRSLNFEAFALVYNGPRQAENRYSEKMAAAYKLALHARGLDA